ncbi:hypothetical protein XENOCAPTIV_012991 [Xenoophorus captivus]|uniref:Uncharacterized protein n=1 Tax=Xenoophorus captivus TaxID=1517983 RepID=A0ABV0SHS4_9TELE
MHQPGKRAGQANHSRPSTSHQLPQCGLKTCSTSPPTHLTANHSLAPGARVTDGSTEGRPPKHAQDRAPQQPQTQTREGSRMPPPTPRHGTPRCLKRAGQPLHQSEATSQLTLHTAWARPPCWSPKPLPNRWTGHRSQGPRSKAIQTILRGS